MLKLLWFLIYAQNCLLQVFNHAHLLIVLLPFDLLQHLIVTSLLRAILLHYRVFLKCYFFLITEFVGMDLQVRIITILEMYTEM